MGFSLQYIPNSHVCILQQYSFTLQTESTNFIMAKTWISFTQWFVRQKIAVQLTCLILGLSGIVYGVTSLLIQNYERQAVTDAQTIKDKDLQMQVMRINFDAHNRRTDSIHRLELNNERLSTKALFDQSMKERQEMMRYILNEKAKLKSISND